MIDEFKIVRIIEKGFTATIYEGEYGGRSYAIKKYNPEKKMYAKQEFELACMLNHENLVKYFYLREAAIHLGENPAVCCIILMEYASEGELLMLLKRVGPFSEILARTYFHMLIAAVEHMHSMGVYHLDIKLQNILLDSDFNLKLSDFGFSSVSQINSSLLGTNGYAAPEILTQNDYRSQPADVFSCGVVLFALVFKDLPFASSHKSDKKRMLLQEEPTQFWEMLPQKPNQLRNLLTKMLQENCNKRATIQVIKNHPWYQGDVMMGHELTEQVRILVNEYRDRLVKNY